MYGTPSVACTALGSARGSRPSRTRGKWWSSTTCSGRFSHTFCGSEASCSPLQYVFTHGSAARAIAGLLSAARLRSSPAPRHLRHPSLAWAVALHRTRYWYFTAIQCKYQCSSTNSYRSLLFSSNASCTVSKITLMGGITVFIHPQDCADCAGVSARLQAPQGAKYMITSSPILLVHGWIGSLPFTSTPCNI